MRNGSIAVAGAQVASTSGVSREVPLSHTSRCGTMRKWPELTTATGPTCNEGASGGAAQSASTPMVPDVAFENFLSGSAVNEAAHGGRPRSYDYNVKRSGFLEHMYSARDEHGVPMQQRADSVRKEWIRKAAEAGRVWSSVPKGAGGPIQRRYQSRPVIKGLAFGFYGDWSRGLGNFIAEMAKKGGRPP